MLAANSWAVSMEFSRGHMLGVSDLTLSSKMWACGLHHRPSGPSLFNRARSWQCLMVGRSSIASCNAFSLAQLSETSLDLLVLSGSQVDEVVEKLNPDDLMNLMARVFADLAMSRVTLHNSESTGSVTIPHRSTIVGLNHRTLFMPSRIRSFGTAIKIVSVPTASAPEEVKGRGLPGTTAVLDDYSGEVVALVNARKLTALRNAASKLSVIHMSAKHSPLARLTPGSLLATRLMLPPNRKPTTLVAFGAGAQIAAHVSLFLSSYPTIRACQIFNRSLNLRLTELINSMQKSHPNVKLTGHPLEIHSAENAELKTAVRSADIIITATSSTQPLFPSSYVSPSAHICLIGSYTPAM